MEKMSKELNAFLDKAQRIAKELYEECNSFDELRYSCPLTDTMDRLYEFSLMKKEDAIK